MPPALRRLTTELTSGPAWPLGTYLAIALLLRLPAILFADGYEFVDQQYQYIDPAWHLATGQAWLPTWEWSYGIRSWVYPGWLAGVFRTLLWFGLEEPFWLMRGVRAVHAVISLLPLWLFWLCIVRWRPIANPRLPLLLFAGSGLLINLGVQPSGLALGGTLAVAAVLAFHGPRWFPWLSGLLLGLAFCGRVQEALFGPALFAVGMWQRRYAATAALCLGCLPGLLLQGFTDLATYGTFFCSPWDYFRANILDGKAATWTTQPWWFYWVIGVVPVVWLVPPWAGVAWRRLLQGASLLPAAAAAAALHLVAHSCVARKTLRFEYSALALLLAVVLAGLGACTTAERRSRGYQRGVIFLQVLLFGWASLLVGEAGAIGAATALRAQPGFHGKLVVVDGDETNLGGAYYLRQQHLEVVPVAREQLRAHLLSTAPAEGTFLIAVRDDLDGFDLGGAGQLLPLGRFFSVFDRRTRDRRFLYHYVR